MIEEEEMDKDKTMDVKKIKDSLPLHKARLNPDDATLTAGRTKVFKDSNYDDGTDESEKGIIK